MEKQNIIGWNAEKIRMSGLKKSLVFALSVILFFGCCIPLSGQEKNLKKPEYYKVSEVRIFINQPSDVSELRRQGLSFENIKLSEDYFDAQLDSLQIEALKQTGYFYDILIDDLTQDYLDRTKESRETLKAKKASDPNSFGLGSMGGFYTLSEVIAQLDSMRVRYPNLITAKDSIGTSVEGRPIWAVKISDDPNVDENEPEIFFNALTHGNEQLGMMALVYFIYHLLENYGTDPEVTYLVNNRELFFIPVINPDGYAYNEQISPAGGGMWRKNRKDYGEGKFGADLNRNYGYMWGYDNIGSSPNPAEWNYRGTGPFSEPETQIIREFCKSHHFIISNSFHVPTACVWPPWGYNVEQTVDSLKFNSLIKLSTAMNSFLNGFYLPEELLTVNGYVDDWMYGDTIEKNRIFGFTTEASNPVEGPWPIPERITPLAEENLYLNMVFAWGPGIIENPPWIASGTINHTFLNPLTDTLRIDAVEHNPDKHTSNVFAQLLNQKDSVLAEQLLSQSDSAFSGIFAFDPGDEGFYSLRLKQSGTDIPSNLYFSDKTSLSFTTVPLLLDSLPCSIVSNTKYSFKPYFKNAGNSQTISNNIVNLTNNDPWVTTSTPVKRGLATLTPGLVKGVSSAFTLSYDTNAFPGYFNLKFSISSNGLNYWEIDTTLSVPTGVQEAVSMGFMLEQNFPNPFNQNSTIRVILAQPGDISLKIYNSLGQLVAIPLNGWKDSGLHEVLLNGMEYPAGVYFYQLQTKRGTTERKFIVYK